MGMLLGNSRRRMASHTFAVSFSQFWPETSHTEGDFLFINQLDMWASQSRRSGNQLMYGVYTVLWDGIVKERINDVLH